MCLLLRLLGKLLHYADILVVVNQLAFNLFRIGFILNIHRQKVGKISVINPMKRFYDVGSGSVQIDGVDIKDYNVKWLRLGFKLF